MVNKPKLLCILHRSPPLHGAAKVGDFISQSEKLHESYDCQFITIRSSESIGEIGKISIKKFYLVVELYLKVLWSLLVFRPHKIYYTASIKSVAFYRDLLISTLWKTYKLFRSAEVYYHYHTKGVDKFVSSSERNRKLTRFFVKDVNLILLSPLLEKDFDRVKSYKEILFLPNGIHDQFIGEDFNKFVNKKYQRVNRIEILYLAHMMQEKGYDEVLKLIPQMKDQDIHFHFAGSWLNSEDEKFFTQFVLKHNIEKFVTYHGFVDGEEKRKLFKKAHILVYPSKNDAFPLTLLESLSYGLPVIASNEGSIPYILDEKCGMIINDMNIPPEVMEKAKQEFLGNATAIFCRKRYLDHFTLDKFEENLVNIFRDINRLDGKTT